MRAQARDTAGKVLGAALLALGLPVLLAVAVVAAPFLAASFAYNRWRAAKLQRAFAARWGASGKDLLLVYSNSPHWKDYVESRWLPALADRAVVLNWSERAVWTREHPLEAAVFQQWAGDRSFNPIAIVVPRQGAVRTVRFWEAFRDYRHGRETPLRKAEHELARILDVPLPGTQIAERPETS
jgi:hypothetical protein